MNQNKIDISEIQKQINLLKERFNLVDHPEGGMYSDPAPYNCQEIVEVNKIKYSDDDNQRLASTFIYYFMQYQDISTWHRLKSDEIWHYYEGNSEVIIYTFNFETKQVQLHLLGNTLKNNQASYHAIIKNGEWFGAKLRDQSLYSYALLGVTVAPGFVWKDFDLINKKEFEQQNETYIKGLL